MTAATTIVAVVLGRDSAGTMVENLTFASSLAH